MKLKNVIDEDKQKLLEIAYFMSLTPDRLNEGVGDGIMRIAKQAGLHIGSGRGLIQILAGVGSHISKIIYYAIKANTGDMVAREELKTLLKKRASKEELVDFFLRLDTLTLHALTGPIHIIDAVAGWHIGANLKDMGKNNDQRIKDALHGLGNSIGDLPDKLKRKIISNIEKIKKIVGI